jgi:hypothetical protein
MPAPSFVGRTAFYEDFPYAWWNDFDGQSAGLGLDLPAGVGIEPEYSDISEVIDRKAAGLRVYASQLPRLFESEQGMLDDLFGYHSRVALAGGVHGYAERYWATIGL